MDNIDWDCIDDYVDCHYISDYPNVLRYGHSRSPDNPDPIIIIIMAIFMWWVSFGMFYFNLSF
jgi:hypothetical protein